MTNPLPLSPHFDPSFHTGDHVTLIEHVTVLIATLDRRFDTLHQDLKDSVSQRLADADLRYQQRFDGQNTALDAARVSAKEGVTSALITAAEAVNKAEAANERRFDAVNEFRGQLSDQAATFMPRAEAEQRWAALSEKIDDRLREMTTQVTELRRAWDTSTGREAAVPTLTSRMEDLATKVDQLRTYQSTEQGNAAGSNIEARLERIAAQIDRNSSTIVASGARTQGKNESWTVLLGVVGLVSTVLAIFFALRR